MFFCISLPFQAISVIQGKFFSTLYRPTNLGLGRPFSFKCREGLAFKSLKFKVIPHPYHFSQVEGGAYLAPRTQGLTH